MDKLSGTAHTVLSQALARIEAGAGLASFPAYEHQVLVDALEAFGHLFDIASEVVNGTASVAELNVALCGTTDHFEAVA